MKLGRAGRVLAIASLFIGTFLTSNATATYTFTLGDPQANATYYGPYNITGSASSDSNTFTSLTAFIDGANVAQTCSSPATKNCSLDYYKIYGYLAESNHGTHKYKLGIYDGSSWQYSPEQSFFVDRTPSISIRKPAPSSTVFGTYSAAGTVTFTPTRNVTKGYIYAYMDSSSSYFASKTCQTEVCDFSFPRAETQGTHTLKITATSFGAQASQTVTFYSDRSPQVNLISPVGTVAQYFDITGNVTFTPQPGATVYYGYIYAYVDGVQVGGYQGCPNLSCDFNTRAWITAPGQHTVKLRATSNGADVSVESNNVYVDVMLPKNNPTETSRGPSSNQCYLSTANIISGNVTHSQNLFTTSNSPLPTTIDLFYNSQDEMYIPAQQGFRYSYKLPLGQGWSHTYDISLFKNPDGTMVLRGGGLSKRFFTPAGTGYTSQLGDSSFLVKNADGTYTLTHRDGLKYNFDTAGRITSIVDRFNNTVTISGISSHKVTITDPAGRVTTLTYDYYDEKIQYITDPDLNVYDFTYDSTTGILSKVTYPAPTANDARPFWSYTYNSIRLMNSKTDPMGNTTTYYYDNFHRAQSGMSPELRTKKVDFYTGSNVFTEENGAGWTSTFDSAKGVVTGKIDPAGNSTSYTYNTVGLMDSETSPVDQNTTYTKRYQYDTYGNVIDLQGNATRYVRDTNGNIISTTDDPVDLHLGYTYDYANFDQVKSITNYLDSPPTVTQFLYDTDPSGYRRTTMTDPAGNQTVTRFESTGNVKDITSPNGAVSSFTYDGKGILQSITDASGVKTVFSNFDGKGNPRTVQVIDATGTVRQTSTFEYDTLGRNTKLTQPGSPSNYVTTFGYDKNGNRTSLLDAAQHQTNYLYNFRGQVTKTTDALLKDTITEYNGCSTCGGNGALTAVQDADGNRTTFEYDQTGKLYREVPPIGDPLRYDYTPAGLVWHKYNDRTGEVLVTFGYDPQGRLFRKDFLDGNWATFSYYPGGELLTAANQNISYTYEWYPNGWLKKVADSNGRVISYDQYDGAGQRKQVTLLPGTADQKNLSYGYDSKGRLQTIGSAAGSFTFGYDELGRRGSLSYPNGEIAIYSYHQDQPAWLTGITYAGNLPIYSVSYPSFDMVGNRTTKVENGATNNYLYDVVYRLLSTGVENFTYDAVGNRLTGPTAQDTGYTYNAGNQLTVGPVATYDYDNLGNQTRNGAWIYSWNSDGRLVQASSPGITVTFKYDPFGRRIEKAVTGGPVHSYVYDAEDIALEYVDGTLTTQYVHGLGIDEPLVIVRGGQTYYYHVDGLGSVTVITDSAQQIVQTYTYDSFGKPTISNLSLEQPYLFTSREHDSETGLYFFRERYQNPVTSLFISRDKAGFAGGDVVLYGYTNGNPVNYTDPKGFSAYLATRQIGFAVPSDSLLSHTFIYTTNPDGTIKHTYTWGNKYDDKKRGLWSIDLPEDVQVAMYIYPIKSERGIYLGDETYDKALEELVAKWQNDPNHSSRHKHGGILDNCKTEARRLAIAAKLRQNKSEFSRWMFNVSREGF